MITGGFGMTIDLQSGATEKWTIDNNGNKQPMQPNPYTVLPNLIKIWFETITDRIVFENELGIKIDCDHVIVTRAKYIELWSKFKWLRDKQLKVEDLRI